MEKLDGLIASFDTLWTLHEIHILIYHSIYMEKLRYKELNQLICTEHLIQARNKLNKQFTLLSHLKVLFGVR